MPPRPRRTAPAGAAPAPRSRFAAALREMAEQEVGVQGRKVEAARRLVHELHTVGVRAIHELIFDPRHRLLDRGFACAHRDPPMKGAPAAPPDTSLRLRALGCGHPLLVEVLRCEIRTLPESWRLHWPGSLDHANWILTRPDYSGKWHTVATLHIPLDREKPVALARQIQAHLERLIRDGHLGDGVKLPATRELAKSLGVNRATVAFAYDELVAAGHARAHVGQGTFVVSLAKPPRPAPEVRVRTPINWTGLLSRS